MKSLPSIAVTMGDPTGIGPEVLVKAIADPVISNLAYWIILGDQEILEKVAQQANLSFNARLVEDTANILKQEGVALIDPKQLNSSCVIPGQISIECGRAALTYIRLATQLCLEEQASAMVTAPINKKAIALSGIDFSGHTEFIAQLCGATYSRLMLTNEQLSVVHVSTHRSLRQACELDKTKILLTIQLGHQALRMLGCDSPKIAVCGLNPHAGEHGLFGDDESKLIVPAIQAAQQMGIDCSGPFPADTLFLEAVQGSYHLIVAMYHDQGHVPMKLLAFQETVNITLGLPIIRTSVDHGTAFDIAGKNQADPTNMKEAMKLAVKMIKMNNKGNKQKLCEIVA